MDRTAGERCYSGVYALRGGRSGPEHFEARGTASARQRLIEWTWLPHHGRLPNFREFSKPLNIKVILISARTRLAPFL